jgi:hypothetical protein
MKYMSHAIDVGFHVQVYLSTRKCHNSVHKEKNHAMDVGHQVQEDMRSKSVAPLSMRDDSYNVILPP